MQVGVIEYELQEFAILVGKTLEDFFLLALPLFALFEDEHDDRKRERKRLHNIEHQFAILEQGHDRDTITGFGAEANGCNACTCALQGTDGMLDVFCARSIFSL